MPSTSRRPKIDQTAITALKSAKRQFETESDDADLVVSIHVIPGKEVQRTDTRNVRGLIPVIGFSPPTAEYNEDEIQIEGLVVIFELLEHEEFLSSHRLLYLDGGFFFLPD